LAQHAEHWGIERVAVVDRVILSIAVFEMKYGRPPLKQPLRLTKRWNWQRSLAAQNPEVSSTVCFEASEGQRADEVGA